LATLRTSRHILAAIYRRLLLRTRLVGITGSCGKTTTTRLVAAVLATKGRVQSSPPESFNFPTKIASNVLRTNPLSRFAVYELSGAFPGRMARSVRVMRPDVGVVTQVGYDHYRNFRDLDLIAREKSGLIAGLPEGGVAVLNHDDDRVAAMGRLTRARALTYGLGEGADVRGVQVSSRWPERLQLSVVHAGLRRHVHTRLLGDHWAHAVLAAIGVGLAMGVALEDAIAAIADVEPVAGRMHPHEIPGGITMVDDTWKAPHPSVEASLRWLQQARASRRIAVIGTVSDYPSKSARAYRRTVRHALAAADLVVCVGDRASSALRAHASDDRSRLQVCRSVRELRASLARLLGAGDLVLLKGARRDHLERLVLDRTQPLACWRDSCALYGRCTDCALRHQPERPGSAAECRA